MSKILVTGAAGFLGKYVTDYFVRQDNKVYGIDNFDNLCGFTRDTDSFHLDILDVDGLDWAINSIRPDTIIHLAAYGRNLTCQHFAHKAWNVNVNGTLNVLDKAYKYKEFVKRVVCCSSNIVLSDQPTVYKETKLAVEQLVRLYSTLGVSCMGLRPSNIYGKGQSKIEYQPCAFAGLDNSYAKDGYFTITGDGTQARDFTHAKDVARAFYLASKSNIVGSTFDVCTNELTSMNKVAELLGVSIKYIDPRPGDAKVLISDPNPAFEHLGFKSEVRLSEAIWDAFPSIKKVS
jgi:UDP-glucose 4-epimerase